MNYYPDDSSGILSFKITQDETVGNIETYFSDFGQNLVTSATFCTLILGLMCNTLVLMFFYKVVDTKPIQSSLWANLSVCYLVKCLVLLYSACGDLWDYLSDTEEKCRIRYALPLSMDIVCISCFLMILIERTVALHCPAFYSIMQEHTLTFHFFCWLYGASYFLFVFLEIQVYDCPVKCKTPYTHMSPVDTVQTVSFLTAVILILSCLISMLFLFPTNYSKVERIRLQMEINGTYLVIAFGTVVLVFWIPRQIIIVLFWFGEINMAKYTIAVKWATLVLDLSVLLPFLALLSTLEFRSAAYCLVTMTSTRAIKRKIMAQESYKSTIRKLVEAERKASASQKERSKLISFSNRSITASIPERHTEVSQVSMLPEPQARNDYLIGQDLVATSNLDM